MFWPAPAVQLGCVALYPAPDGHVIDAKVSLGHDFFQISEAEPKPEIPPDTQNDDLGFKMSSFEQRWPVPIHEPRAYQTVSPSLQHFRLRRTNRRTLEVARQSTRRDRQARASRRAQRGLKPLRRMGTTPGQQHFCNIQAGD